MIEFILNVYCVSSSEVRCWRAAELEGTRGLLRVHSFIVDLKENLKISYLRSNTGLRGSENSG